MGTLLKLPKQTTCPCDTYLQESTMHLSSHVKLVVPLCWPMDPHGSAMPGLHGAGPNCKVEPLSYAKSTHRVHACANNVAILVCNLSHIL